MQSAPKLLNDDGGASMATMLMMSHHAFRRDLARFEGAVEAVARGDVSRVDAVRAEWQEYRGALHGHHTIEDTAIFPDLRTRVPVLAAVLDRLTSDHHHIDPLLVAGDAAFAALPGAVADARSVLAQLRALLDPHLAIEEAEVAPHLRGAKSFPPPSNDAEADLYARGFAWSSYGIAPDVLDKVYAILPDALTSRLPQARADFAARCARVWGPSAREGAARTPIPEL
jgi:hemerythrin-like domain-containing protein